MNMWIIFTNGKMATNMYLSGTGAEREVILFTGGTVVRPLRVTQDSIGFRVGLEPEQVNGVPAEQTVKELFMAERRRQTGYDQDLCKMGQGALINYLNGNHSSQELEELARLAVSQIKENTEGLSKYQVVDYALGALLADVHGKAKLQ
jgi:hypothetical protein